MSADYLLKMELLQNNREELTARRQEIERRMALREATAAEYSAVALQRSKQEWKRLRSAAISAKRQNDEFIREIHETQRKVDELYVRTNQKLWPSDNQLEIEKERYMRKVEELYPAWQEKMQTVRVQTLRELEDKKRAIEKRRYLAKKTFETEQTMDDLIRQTSHEIELAKNLEKNEAFERNVLRSQSTVQAMHMEETIREHALGARMYMQQQAVEQLRGAQQLQEDVQDKLFETFSPRGAVQAMRQANQSITIVDSSDKVDDEESHRRPQRAQSIVIPQQKYPHGAVVEQHHDDNNTTPSVVAASTHPVVRDARTCAGSGFDEEEETKEQPIARLATIAHAHPITQPVVTKMYSPVDVIRAKEEELVGSTQSHFTATDSVAAAPSTFAPPISSASVLEGALRLVAPSTPPPANEYTKENVQESATATPHAHAAPVAESTPAANSIFTTPSHRATTAPEEKKQGITEQLHAPPPSPQTLYSFVEVTRQEPKLVPPPTIAEEDHVEDKSSKHNETAVGSMDSISSSAISPTKSDFQNSQPNDLTLHLKINSFESNASSAMDFSIGKLLQTPPKEHFVSKAVVVPSDSPPRHTHQVDKSPITAVEAIAAAETPSASSNGSPPPSSSQAPYLKSSFARTFESESLVFSSLDSTSDMGSPAPQRAKETILQESTMLESVSDFGSPEPTKASPLPATRQATASETTANNTAVSSPASPSQEQANAMEEVQASLVATLSMPERLKALTALITRVEEGANDGEQFSSNLDTGTSRETKRDLLRMAVTGRKAQINFFGSDVCFELVVDLARELGPVLFPAKAFEGIMNDQKMKKVHQNAKEKEADLWKAFATHLKQLHTLRVMPVAALVDLFTDAFLRHDPTNQRSQRKAMCGVSDSTPKKDVPSLSPRQSSGLQRTDSVPMRSAASVETPVPVSPQIPTLLQTAFLQQSSPTKAKTYGIASSGFKKKSRTDDVLSSMASTPTKLSHKLLRGGKMGDYSEFEEEEEVDLDNLIGTKPSIGAAAGRGGSSGSLSRSNSSFRGAASTGGGGSMARGAKMTQDKDDFDADF